MTATFDAEIGAVEFTSQNGELWFEWDEKLGSGRDEDSYYGRIWYCVFGGV